MYVVHTDDLTFRGIYEDYTTCSLDDALTESRARWNRFTVKEMLDRRVTVYLISEEDYRHIQEGVGTFDNYAFGLLVYVVNYIDKEEVYE